MRIQHNIMSMNAYRNLTTNNNSLSGNLEKLSSGYRINRAGDDAAGLAISEKMRAQITGLDVAQDNAQSGINLVQTAEGALTEVHDMLNRMYELAEQSANGTYDDEDRDQLQKEVSQLKTEIDRIADGTNFNGINLLNGSLGAASGNLDGKIQMMSSKAVTAVATGAAFTGATGAHTYGDTLKYTVTWEDGNGTEHVSSFNFKVDDKDLTKLIAEDGTVYTIGSTAITNANFTAAIGGEMLKDSALNAAFDIKSGATFTFTSKVAGTEGAKITGLSLTASYAGAVTGGGIDATKTVTAIDSMQMIDHSKFGVVGTASTALTTEAINSNVFEIDGKKFVLVANGVTTASMGNVPSDVTVIRLAGNTYSAANDAAAVAAELTRVTGKQFATVAAVNTAAGLSVGYIVYKGDEELTTGGEGGELTLQIGDTSEEYNQLKVSISDCHTNSMGIDELDVSDQKGASAALNTIRSAIKYVSDVRGTLGAAQNRLEHTINNLSVTEENIQDAESTIRDTDVAEEMMEYTKNNILIQSAQAMLAQANQVPQGVLQLLG